MTPLEVVVSSDIVARLRSRAIAGSTPSTRRPQSTAHVGVVEMVLRESKSPLVAAVAKVGRPWPGVKGGRPCGRPPQMNHCRPPSARYGCRSGLTMPPRTRRRSSMPRRYSSTLPIVSGVDRAVESAKLIDRRRRRRCRTRAGRPMRRRLVTTPACARRVTASRTRRRLRSPAVGAGSRGRAHRGGRSTPS